MIIFIIHSVFVLYFLVEIAVVKFTILHPAFKLFFSGGFQYFGQSIADQSAISLIICATGICWNQVVCKRLAGSQRILGWNKSATKVE